MDWRDSRDVKKGHYSQWSASFGEPRDGSCVCGVHHEFTKLHIHLPLFTRAHQRSDLSSQLFKSAGGEEGAQGEAAPLPTHPPTPSVTVSASRWLHKHYSVRRKSQK